jgi:hypothetical protein
VIWLTWRQHRGQVLALAIGIGVVGVVLLLTGRQMADAFRDTGIERCLQRQGNPAFVTVPTSGCTDLADAFAARFFDQRLLALVVFIVLPVLAGMFLGAPVVARELEQGTHQGVSRTRWAAAKIGLLASILAVAAAVFALIVQWWFGPLNAATGERFTWLIFDQQGSVLVGYALFAFALGVFLGAVTRRTVRAMGITLAVFFVVRFAVAVWIRPRYLAEQVRTYSIFGGRIPNPLLGDFLIGGGGPGIGGIYDGAGRFIKGGQTICPGENVTACVTEFGRGAHNLEIYQPASRYWLFQGIETALFVVLAAMLLLAAVWWVRRRLT